VAGQSPGVTDDVDPAPGRSGFADLIGLEIVERRSGYSRGELTVADELLNPNEVLHGSVAHAMADTGMGAALMAALDEGEACATIEIKISYLRPVTDGKLVCETEVINRGGSVAFLESEVRQGERVVADATGSFAIFEV
jgi:acyl-CoA thioesterase